MKKLLLAASMAAGVAAGAVPAFAQSATTSQPALGDNGAAPTVQAQNYIPAQNYDQTQATTGDTAHIGDGGPNYLMQQQELRNMRGYNITGGD